MPSGVSLSIGMIISLPPEVPAIVNKPTTVVKASAPAGAEVLSSVYSLSPVNKAVENATVTFSVAVFNTAFAPVAVFKTNSGRSIL